MFTDAPMLSGTTIRLEPLTLDHVPGLCAVGLDPELWRWMTSRVDDEADVALHVRLAVHA